MHDDQIPSDFRTALLSLRETTIHHGLLIEEIPAPTGLAPYTAALALHTHQHNHDTPLASARFVILHDTHTRADWQSTFRLVAYMRTQIDPEMSADPLLAEAIWHLAHDCFDEAGAGYRHLTGTVTREISESFGGLTLTDTNEYLELRASWTPATPYLGEHLTAWTTLLARASGLSPQYA